MKAIDCLWCCSDSHECSIFIAFKLIQMKWKSTFFSVIINIKQMPKQEMAYNIGTFSFIYDNQMRWHDNLFAWNVHHHQQHGSIVAAIAQLDKETRVIVAWMLSAISVLRDHSFDFQMNRNIRCWLEYCVEQKNIEKNSREECHRVENMWWTIKDLLNILLSASE